VIDDSYNANPDSVRAAIDVLAHPAPRILVLGDMGEVGTQGREFHEEIGAYAQSRGIETVLATGELSRHMAASGASPISSSLTIIGSTGQQLGSNSDATVLVKGSRFMKMERVVNHLTGSTKHWQGSPLIMLLWLAQYQQDLSVRCVSLTSSPSARCSPPSPRSLIGLFTGPAVIRKLTEMKVGQAVRTTVRRPTSKNTAPRPWAAC
jgi:hypothetical protein